MLRLEPVRCWIGMQVKPLLERVLNLPPESLAKEIKLTQVLLALR